MSGAILIPAYNPEDRLLKLIDDLQAAGLGNIVVVNDGSKKSCAPIFDAVRANRSITLLEHSVNMGKGAAMKTGFDYIYSHMPDITGVITADADGQHTPKDIGRLITAMEQTPDALILGARQFDKDVPFRSMLGNKTTRVLMRILLGLKITDTQTGLRAIPREFIPDLLEIPYNRYEFELEMLLVAQQLRMKISEITIETVYLDGNSSSHFNPLLDSAKIYFVLFRYIASSIITAIFDYIIFFLVVGFFPLWGAIAISRGASVILNYGLVRNMVFSSKAKIAETFPKYILLVITSGFLSYLMTLFFATHMNIKPLIGKLIAEAILYLANFVIQKELIFTKRYEKKKTDWDDYYENPYETAAFSRKIVTNRLMRLLTPHCRKGEFSIAELGGANSCFYEVITKELKPVEYHIFDNNDTGLDKLTERIKPDASAPLRIHNTDIIKMKTDFKTDVVFSVGLIEHFNKEGTRKAVEAHFELVKDGGTVILFFPTPTLLYGFTRFLAELFRLWIFHDERPLRNEEVESYIEKYGTVIHRETIWPIFLTQSVLVIRKN